MTSATEEFRLSRFRDIKEMCIRDSFPFTAVFTFAVIIRYYLHKAVKISVYIVPVEELPKSVEVELLDVYKRQTSRCSGAISFAISQALSISSHMIIAPQLSREVLIISFLERSVSGTP